MKVTICMMESKYFKHLCFLSYYSSYVAVMCLVIFLTVYYFASMNYLGRCLMGWLEDGALALLVIMKVLRWAHRFWKVIAGVQVSKLNPNPPDPTRFLFFFFK